MLPVQLLVIYRIMWAASLPLPKKKKKLPAQLHVIYRIIQIIQAADFEDKSL